MQYATVELRLGGLLTNTVFKHDVTPAEILIFRHIHGDESIASIVQKDRLVKAFPKYFEFIDRAFPGPIPQNLPTNFADVGVAVDDFQQDRGDEFTARGKTTLNRGALEEDPVFKAAIAHAAAAGDEIVVEVDDKDLKRLDDTMGLTTPDETAPEDSEASGA